MDLPVKFLFEVWSTLCQMAPYLLFGFLCAGLLSVLISEEKVEKHLGGKGFKPVLKATLLGIPLPLCSCGVIPVFASLRKKGAGKGAATGFLISTPQTGVDSILVTYSMLGPVFAIFRPLAAFVSGILGGMLVDLFDKEEKKCSTGILPVSADKDENLEKSTCRCHDAFWNTALRMRHRISSDSGRTNCKRGFAWCGVCFPHERAGNKCCRDCNRMESYRQTFSSDLSWFLNGFSSCLRPYPRHDQCAYSGSSFRSMLS
jgi:uncharacterized membrane protein YraQ (UPF0718 family)